MALINCPECGRQISDRAPSCPGCGILKEDIQAILAEQNAVPGLSERVTKNNSENATKSQGTEEELVCYPTISAISETEKKRYSEKHETKSQKVEYAEETEQKVKKGRAEEQFNVGDIVTLGTQEEEPIRWIVLETKGDDMLLLSEKCLEIRQYHSVNRPVTWEKSSIRSYLNGKFLEKYFSDQERQLIIQRVLRNHDNQKFATQGGNCTSDRVFLLSIDEKKKYFPDDIYCYCEASKYAIKQAQNTFLVRDGRIRTDRWLRSPGLNEKNAAFIFGGEGESKLRDIGFPVYAQLMIRPALVVHLENKLLCAQV